MAKKIIVKCDICDQEISPKDLELGGYLRIKFKSRICFLSLFKKIREDIIDICPDCGMFIRHLRDNNIGINGFLAVYAVRNDMCIEDKKEFDKFLFEKAKEVHRYHEEKNH